jgi:hypothetical protein
MLGFASVEEAIKVDLFSLYPDRASRDASRRIRLKKAPGFFVDSVPRILRVLALSDVTNVALNDLRPPI